MISFFLLGGGFEGSSISPVLWASIFTLGAVSVQSLECLPLAQLVPVFGRFGYTIVSSLDHGEEGSRIGSDSEGEESQGC